MRSYPELTKEIKEERRFGTLGRILKTCS